MPRLTARVISLVAALSLGLLSIAVFPRTAYACSCQGISSQTAAQRADAIFSGRVIAKSTVGNPAPGRTDIRFDVSRVYKGSVFRQQVVASSRGSDGCGIDPAVNSSWVIFAEERIEGSGDDAVLRLVTALCSGNLAGSTVPTTLGRGYLPLEGASDREERAVTTDAAFTRVLEVGGVILGGLVLVVGAGLAVLWRPSRLPGAGGT